MNNHTNNPTNHRINKHAAAAMLTLGLAASLAPADLTLSWYSLDNGGVTASSVGSLRLGATIGQPDAGTLETPNYMCIGGFWAGATYLCPSDFDNSGFVDTDDFTAFVTAFELGLDSADFDQTGFVDTDDFTAFVLAFETGC
ncbi:MAG TPA: EF-hand domain-containing protein [Phycisphaerales bacterium]|nr:EF-hand domain-containing protein [Phycisphaerales bacterium]